MVSKIFSAFSSPQNQEPAQRLQALEALPPDSKDMARFLTSDPDPEVRSAAAGRCRDIEVLQGAWANESDPGVRAAIAAALTSAVAAIESEETLLGLAITAERAETRIAAAARVHTPEALKKLADAAKDKDRGVARLARQRIDALHDEQRKSAECEAICVQLEALAADPGAILTAVIDLDRRWSALGIAAGDERHARFDRVRHAIQARFEREQDEPKRRFHFERRLRELVASLEPALADPAALAALRSELAALKQEAGELAHEAALAQLAHAEELLHKSDVAREALAAAEALVAEAELVAPSATDSAGLLERWYALDAAARTSTLKRRFKAAVATIDQRRLEQQQSAKQDVAARRHQLHGVLHSAEQALAAGQLQAARSAADELKALKAGTELPKPTQQRLSRLLQQLTELERWEHFGQRSARTQLCERAEALAGQTLDAAQVAAEVRKLREEWKTLDQQHAGVPKSLWQRFDAACEKAYAPAARHFAELGARNKEARTRRKQFIAAAQAHAQGLLGEARDWRALEQWLRDTERAWREGALGSVDPGSWKKLDAQLKSALAPVREALSAATAEAIARRKTLLSEAASLSSRALEREAPGRIRDLQARWQAEAKALTLPRREERELWEAFRSACDAVFQARDAGRKQAEEQRSSARTVFEALCKRLENIASDSALDEAALRLAAREAHDQWNAAAGPAPRELHARFTRAKSSVDAALSARASARKAIVWDQLAQKERLCEELELLVTMQAPDAAARSQALREQWDALPALPSAWEKKMCARRDAALQALEDEEAAAEYRDHVEDGAALRRQMLVELELAMGLETPAEDRAQRLALQVKRLKERFDRGAAGGTEGTVDQVLGWCARPGICAGSDRERSDRIFSRIRQTPLK